MKRKRTKIIGEGTASVMVRLDAEQAVFVEALSKAMCNTQVQVLRFAVEQLRRNPNAIELMKLPTQPEGAKA